ncbi:hypothetical protein [Longimicrobium sp.]|uniref:hypothetical protein n=1 Tax=Longimicrobium sp. TaxID=2029185 RepID=UPI002F948290
MQPLPTCPPRRNPVRQRAAALLIVGVAACSEAEAGPQAWPTRKLDDVVTWGPEIRLQESETVITVAPVLHHDPGGGFLVADRREAQGRLYDPAGRLRGQFGARGRGPGEFDGLVAALRLSSGEIAAVDVSGKLAVYDSAGARVLRTWQTEVMPLYDAEVIGGSLLLLVGRGRDKAGPLLHLFDPRTGRVLRRFHPDPGAPGMARGSSMTAGFADATVYGDTIALVHSLSDTLSLLSPSGAPLGRIAIPFQHFRSPRASMPRRPTREQTHAWLSSFSLVSHAFRTGDGGWLIQYQDRDGPAIHWRLLRMSAEGRRLFELRDTPQLLATDPRSGALYFVHPASEVPSVWAVAQLRAR